MSAHAPGQLSNSSCSEQRCQSGHSSVPFVKGEMAAPGAYHDTLPQVPQGAPTLSHPGYVLLKTCWKI